MNEAFGGDTKSGIYHSIYDSIYWYSHFSDATYADGRALSQFTATALLRLGGASVLPFEFDHFANTVTGYVDDIEKQAKKDGHEMTFATIRQQLAALKRNGDKYNALLHTAMAKNTLDAGRVKALNESLMRTERVLTRPEGLPNREWYKHQIYAPGFYTGYGVKTIPGVREAVDSKNWPLAQKEAGIVDRCLTQMNQVVNQAISEAGGL
jgi:N-acetylated-alpha-linked acidic dipeptidase